MVDTIPTNFRTMGYDPDNAQYEWIQNGWGGGVRYVKIPIAYDTPNLLTGAPLYIPEQGDMLFDVRLSITTPWNGTTPSGNFYISGTVTSFYSALSSFDMTLGNTITNGLTSIRFKSLFGNGDGFSFANSNPVTIVISQNGSIGGLNPGSTQGAGFVYIGICSPTTLSLPQQ